MLPQNQWYKNSLGGLQKPKNYPNRIGNPIPPFFLLSVDICYHPAKFLEYLNFFLGRLLLAYCT